MSFWIYDLDFSSHLFSILTGVRLQHYRCKLLFTLIFSTSVVLNFPRIFSKPIIFDLIDVLSTKFDQIRKFNFLPFPGHKPFSLNDFVNERKRCLNLVLLTLILARGKKGTKIVRFDGPPDEFRIFYQSLLKIDIFRIYTCILFLAPRCCDLSVHVCTRSYRNAL